MLVKCYVAHEVVLRKKFIKYGFYQDLVGCHFNNYYFVSRKAVLLIRDRDGKYLYWNSGKKCNVIDPNDLIPSIATLECNSCMMKSEDKLSCHSMTEISDEYVGVVGIRPVDSFDKDATWTNGIDLLLNYNNEVQKDAMDKIQDEYKYIDDVRFFEVMKEINDDIMGMLHNRNNTHTKKLINNDKNQKN